MNKIENDPNLKQQEKILDHHPHHGMAPHGTVRKMKPWHAAKVHKPTHEKGQM